MIDALEQNDVAPVVATHHGPGFFLTAHAPGPQIKTGMHQLFAEAEELAEVTKLVALKREMPTSYLQSVNCLVRLRRQQTIDDEASVGLANIKTIAVVRDQNVSLIE